MLLLLAEALLAETPLAHFQQEVTALFPINALAELVTTWIQTAL